LKAKEKTVKKASTKADVKRVLIHSCCAPCTIYPLRRLQEEGVEVVGFFYNPNIHPFTEFEKRLKAVEEFFKEEGVPLVVDASYDVSDFLEQTFCADVIRCEACYRMRLSRAFAAAKEEGVEADAVTSTLLFSKYQDHDVLMSIANEESSKSGVAFHYEDYREGWDEGRRLCRERGIYSQKYCGCIISEGERYSKRIKALKEGKGR
jgi:predicted adenine nucleotide alpha hydrolase (AANH) superfamily ATPase